jgi:hypothetical protein
MSYKYLLRGDDLSFREYHGNDGNRNRKKLQIYESACDNNRENTEPFPRL